MFLSGATATATLDHPAPALDHTAPALDLAATALAQHRDADARRLAEAAAAHGPPAQVERARLIAGIAARALGDFSGAAALLDFHAAHLGDLEPYHQLALGDARFGGGHPKTAVGPFSLARKGALVDALAARAAGRLGDALLASGKPCPAVKAYQDHLEASATPERLGALARAQAACGDAAGARETAHQLWLRYPAHPAAQAQAAAFDRTATAAEHLARAQKLLAAQGPDAALGEIAKGLGRRPKGDLLARLQLLRARALREKHARPAAEAALKAAVRAAPKGRAAAQALTLLGRAAWRRGDFKAADASFGTVAKRGDRLGDEAAYLRAYIPFDRGLLPQAVSRFEAMLAKRPRSRHADEAAWFSAYAQLRLDQREKARAGFARLVRTFPSSPLVPQALYWEARTSAAKDAEPLYRACIRAAPLGYYASLARLRLAELKRPPEPPLTSAVPPAAPKKAPSPEAELAVSLSSVGLWDFRGEALDAAASAVHSADDAMALAALDASLGEWGRSYALANRWLWAAALGHRAAAALALLFPRAYDPTVRDAAHADGLDPAFAWAIMRRESAFDPTVASGARAIGLMQMLAPTARKVSLALGQKAPPDPSDLYRPEIEIPLGVWYLSALAKRFGHAGLAAAAYNAGPKNVSAWLSQRGKLPFDAFVESIPFRETRRYVKSVVGDYLAYRALYPGTEAALPLDTALPPPKPGVTF